MFFAEKNWEAKKYFVDEIKLYPVDEIFFLNSIVAY
jgi:hypothetical protein